LIIGYSSGLERHVATSDEEEKHICRYAGSHKEEALQYTEQHPSPPSPDFARTTALEILGGKKGSYRPTVHCRQRMAERDFDVFDIEYVIRKGKCIDGGSYSEQHKHHKYTFRGELDGVEFDAAFALSAEHDLLMSPLLILITGCFKTRSGKRTKT
jgi:hypothetical protein